MGEHRFEIGFFPGVWDLLHNGHIKALKEAREKCDYLIVGVNKNPTDKKPILTVDERVELLEAVRWWDEIKIYEDDDELYRLDKKPFFHVRFVGADHKEIDHEINAEVVKISRNHNYSTTNLKKRIHEHFLQS